MKGNGAMALQQRNIYRIMCVSFGQVVKMAHDRPYEENIPAWPMLMEKEIDPIVTLGHSLIHYFRSGLSKFLNDIKHQGIC